jgi:hypothetical protein
MRVSRSSLAIAASMSVCGAARRAIIRATMQRSSWLGVSALALVAACSTPRPPSGDASDDGLAQDGSEDQSCLESSNASMILKAFEASMVPSLVSGV